MNEDSGIWFAWYPVQLSDGGWTWLKEVAWKEDINAILGNAILGFCEPEYIYTKIEEI